MRSNLVPYPARTEHPAPYRAQYPADYPADYPAEYRVRRTAPPNPQEMT